MVLQKVKNNLKGHFALYDRWAQSLCAPAVIPKAPNWKQTYAVTRKKNINIISTTAINFLILQNID